MHGAESERAAPPLRRLRRVDWNLGIHGGVTSTVGGRSARAASRRTPPQVLTSMYTSLASPTQSDRGVMAWLLLPLVACLTCFVIDTHAVHVFVGGVVPCVKLAARWTHEAFNHHGHGDAPAAGGGLGGTPRSGGTPKTPARRPSAMSSPQSMTSPGGTKRTRARGRAISLYRHDAVDVHVRVRARCLRCCSGLGWGAAARVRSRAPQPRCDSVVLAAHPEHNVTFMEALRGVDFWLLFLVRGRATRGARAGFTCHWIRRSPWALEVASRLSTTSDR